MNDNKEIKKLSETGEQSAEIVSGGKGVKSLIPEDGMHDSPIPSISYNVYGRYCRDCGKKYSNICMFNGKEYGNEYCESCRKKHMKESKNASEKTTASSESLTESDLSQVSGGTAVDNIEYREFETTCSLCGTKFTARIAKGFAFAGVLRCPSCNAGKSPIIDRSKQLNRLKNFKWLKGNNKVTTQTHEDN